MTEPAKAETKSQLPIAEPNASERANIADARTRIKARRARVTTKIETDEDGSIVNLGPHHADRDGWLSRLDDAFGSNGRQFPLSQINHVLRFARGTSDKIDDCKVNAILAVVDGVQPSNEIEAMLAVQMAVTHDLAMQAILRAQRVDQIPQYDSAAGMAVRLLRTFSVQAEALAKLQRGGEQIVKVVHVHPGGQAVVGNVVTGASGASGSRGGGSDGFRDQPHAPEHESAPARSVAAETCPAMPSADARREPMPVPLCAR